MTKRRLSVHLLTVLFCLSLLRVPGTLAMQEATPIASPVADAIEHGALLPQMDLSVHPGKDFFRYATGGWQDRTEIPADEAAYGITQELRDLTIEQLLALLERLETSDELVVGSDQWKAVQLFAQAMDMRTRNAEGIAPIAAELEAIDALASLDEIYAFVREGVMTSFVYGFYGIRASPDLADSSTYAAWYTGPPLGLPNRDYYWTDDEGNEPIRELEKRLAEPILRPEDFNDPGNDYHPRPIADLIAANPDFDWPAFLEHLGIPEQETIVVTELEYLSAVDAILAG